MIGDVFRKIARFAWFLPGFLLWAAFPPMCECTDCLFALAPLLWLSRQGDRAMSAKRWFQNGAFFWLATLSWMPAIVKNGGPWPLVVLGWLALGAYCAAYFAAFGYLSAAYWGWVGNTFATLPARGRSNCKSERRISSETGRQCSQAVPGLADRQDDCQLPDRGQSNCKIPFRILGIIIVEPVLWCGLELLRSRFLGGFAWNQLGVVPANSGFGAPAAIGGVYLLSAVVILINGTVAGIAERFIACFKARRGQPYDESAVSRWRTHETVLVFVVIWGLYRLAAAVCPAAVEQSGKPLKVALVQRNFPCVFQSREANPYDIYGRLLDHVSALRPDLVVLPESAMCEFGPLDQAGAMRFAAWVREKTGGALLAGGTRYGDQQTFNSAALYQFFNCQTEDGLATRGEHLSYATTTTPITTTLIPSLSIYDKVHLVPFGEFIPGDRLFPILQELAPVGSCTPGDPKLLVLHPQWGQTPFVGGQTPGDGGQTPGEGGQTPSVGGQTPDEGGQTTGEGGQTPSVGGQTPMRLGVAICFEDTDSALVRQMAKMGAETLIFITNDSWFSHSNEAMAHAWQATARAIETGLTVVRVGNSGVTGTIRPDGKATWLVGANGRILVDRSGTMLDRVYAGSRPTPYVAFGDWPLVVFFALLILGMILVKYTEYKRRKDLL